MRLRQPPSSAGGAVQDRCANPTSQCAWVGPARDDVFSAAIPPRALGADMTILNQEQPAHAAAAARLRTEPVIWLTTVARSGQPQSTPVWFLWEAGEVLIYGLANGPKSRNIGSNPYVSLHLEGNGRGGANVIFRSEEH